LRARPCNACRHAAIKAANFGESAKSLRGDHRFFSKHGISGSYSLNVGCTNNP
jgi:hypothetical protein